MTMTERVTKATTTRNARNRTRYHLARSLGLSAEESIIAAHWSIRRIKEYAAQKKGTLK